MNKAIKITVILCLAGILAVFFAYNCYTFWLSDDLNMSLAQTFKKLFSVLGWMYMHHGGALIAFATQMLFCGILPNKMYFNICNTLVFACYVLLLCRLSIAKIKITPPSRTYSH